VIEAVTLNEPEENEGVVQKKIFIGHGKSEQWRILKDFLRERLNLEYEEFNRISTAGINTQERLSEMLDHCGFAFLVLAGEDLHGDGSLHARENVVHESGLFQGRLGWRKAIILLEEECEEFSNIVGLGQIRFGKGNIQSCFEEVRRVLEREDLISK
jgi:predicted nucleotide-binding protein